jgi:hypothetical protein
MDYTQDSRRAFMSAVANKLEYEVAGSASPGPWKLSDFIADAIQGQPAPDGSERHICGLIDPNDSRAAVAGDPDCLRMQGRAMRAAADDLGTPAPVLEALFEVAWRYNESMLLKCSGMLQRETSAPEPGRGDGAEIGEPVAESEEMVSAAAGADGA